MKELTNRLVHNLEVPILIESYMIQNQIDLKSANFLVLKSIDKNLVKGEERYEEFIGDNKT